MNWKLLHYRALQQFNAEFYNDILTKKHLNPDQKHFTKYTKVTTGNKVEANFACWELEKDGVKYLVKSFEPDEQITGDARIDIREELPIKVLDHVPISKQNTLYERVSDWAPVRIKPERTYEYRELIDSLASFKHTSERDQKLWWMIAMAGYLDKVYVRIATEPGFGKDSAIKILGLLTDDVTDSNASVTRAKLEFMTQYKLLALNEFSDLPPKKWENIESFVLDVADDSPTVTKRSRAHNGVGEVIDISDFSVLMFYNDLKNYQEPEDYFDNRAKEAVDDRFVPIRLAGQLSDERFEEAEEINMEELVRDNMGEYKSFIRGIRWWGENYESEVNRDWSADFDDYSLRWTRNLKRIAKSINLYAESEDEFHEYVELLKDRIRDYDRMLMYPSVWDETVQGMDEESKSSLEYEIDRMKTYDQRIALMRDVQRGDDEEHNSGVSLDDY